METNINTKKVALIYDTVRNIRTVFDIERGTEQDKKLVQYSETIWNRLYCNKISLDEAKKLLENFNLN